MHLLYIRFNYLSMLQANYDEMTSCAFHEDYYL